MSSSCLVCQFERHYDVSVEPEVLRSGFGVNFILLGGRFGYFLFFLLGGGEGRVRGAGKGGGRFFIEYPRRGGVSWAGGAGGSRGQEGVCGEFGGGGLNIFFRGRNRHQVLDARQITNCGNGGIRVTLQMQTQIEFPNN